MKAILLLDYIITDVSYMRILSLNYVLLHT